MVSQKGRRVKETVGGSFVDTKKHVVSNYDFNNGLIKNFRSTAAAGVNIRHKIQKSGETYNVDINKIKQQGMKTPILRCPACDLAFPRRPVIARHVSSAHKYTTTAIGDNWRGHVTCQTFGYGDARPAYSKRTRDQIDLDDKKVLNDHEARAQLPRRDLAAAIARIQRPRANVVHQLTTSSAQADDEELAGGSTLFDDAFASTDQVGLNFNGTDRASVYYRQIPSFDSGQSSFNIQAHGANTFGDASFAQWTPCSPSLSSIDSSWKQAPYSPSMSTQRQFPPGCRWSIGALLSARHISCAVSSFIPRPKLPTPFRTRSARATLDSLGAAAPVPIPPAAPRFELVRCGRESFGMGSACSAGSLYR